MITDVEKLWLRKYAGRPPKAKAKVKVKVSTPPEIVVPGGKAFTYEDVYKVFKADNPETVKAFLDTRALTPEMILEATTKQWRSPNNIPRLADFGLIEPNFIFRQPIQLPAVVRRYPEKAHALIRKFTEAAAEPGSPHRYGDVIDVPDLTVIPIVRPVSKLKTRLDSVVEWAKKHKKGLWTGLGVGGSGLGGLLTWGLWPDSSSSSSEGQEDEGSDKGSDNDTAKDKSKGFKHWGALSGGALGGVSAALAAWELSKNRAEWERWLYTGLAAAGGGAAGGYAGSLLDE